MSKVSVLREIEKSAGIGASVSTIREQTGLGKPEVQRHLDDLLTEGRITVDGSMRDPSTGHQLKRYVSSQMGAREQSELASLRRSVASKVQALNVRQLAALDKIIDTTIKRF